MTTEMLTCQKRVPAARPWLLLTLISLLLSACTPLVQYRTEMPDNANDFKSFSSEICEIEGQDTDRKDCSLEHRRYTFKEEGQEKPGEYYLAFVEFDDEGWFWDRNQLKTLLRLIHDADDEFLIFAHAHGWQHNASACDNNVVCFQRYLERMDVTEQLDARRLGQKPRKVLGVYIGWRGRSGKVKTLNTVTFWSRKTVSNKVGIGGVTELLTRLDDMRRFRNPERRANRTQLIISGHSFGGQVVFKALSHLLIGRVTRMGNIDELTCQSPPRGGTASRQFRYCVARSVGDLVILVNPAFEASAYRALHDAATNRCYPQGQRPSMLIVTSGADGATRGAFPMGRRLATFGGKTRKDIEQRQSVLQTVGHFDPFRTHDLKVPNNMKVKPPQKSKEGPCGCPYLAPTTEFDPAAFSGESIRDKDEYATYYSDEIMLLRNPEYAANYPYLVVHTDSEFIPDHNNIFGERFTEFLRRFYVRHLAYRETFEAECFEPEEPCPDGDVLGCQRSWKGSLERSPSR